MDLEALRRQAQKDAQYFLEHDSEYRMGYIAAEQPHPLTRRLSQTYATSMEDGIRLLSDPLHAAPPFSMSFGSLLRSKFLQNVTYR